MRKLCLYAGVLCLAMTGATAQAQLIDFDVASDINDFVTFRDDTPSLATLGIRQNAGGGTASSGGFEAFDIGTSNGSNDMAAIYAPGGTLANGAYPFEAGDLITVRVKFFTSDATRAATPRMGIASFDDIAENIVEFGGFDMQGGKDTIGGNNQAAQCLADGIAMTVEGGNNNPKNFNITNVIQDTQRVFDTDPAGQLTLANATWYQYVLNVEKSEVAEQFNVSTVLNRLNTDGTAVDALLADHSATLTNTGLYTDGEVMVGVTFTHNGAVETMTNLYDDLEITVITFRAQNPSPANGAVFVDPADLNANGLSYDIPVDPNVTGSFVYLSINDPNVSGATPVFVAGTGTGITYIPAGSPFSQDQTVYWRVDTQIDGSAAGAAETVTGQVWTFDTQKSAPVVTGDPQRTSAFVDGTATFTCQFSSISEITPGDVSWTQDGGAARGDVALSLLSPGNYESVLIIFNVTADDAGQYACSINGTTSASASLLIKQLVHHWEFEGDYTDSVGSFDLTPDPNTKVPGFTAGRVGTSAVDPNGTEALIVGSDNAASEVEYYAGYTALLWVKTGNLTQGEWSGIFSTESETDAAFQLDVDGSGNYRYRDGSNTSMGAIEDGVWTMLVVSADPATGTSVYRDGVLTGTDADIQTFISGFSVGTNRNRDIEFEGSIDDIKFWSYPLSQAEIVDEYFAVTNQAVCDPALQNEMDFNGDCLVNVVDFVPFAQAYLDCVILPVSECP